ncbi:CRIB domain-containing protein RIC5 isoform X1 [Rhododendron vialii]|uniref:CRIB domain-containing protein RIC5 isoform X1 n=1 Tax=Rhododendron vialii TaxID=182163 RepID=UPI002660107B|nr:CRIB domain-containing protein RIC5 isoform X1 [Rhododendron vialii]
MTTMKGILKGLRYISQIFDNEKEEEMQIGHPTDVKHVAHIGMDGPSANTPSWMNEYKPNSEGSSVPSNSEPKGKPATKKSSQGQLAMDITDDPSGAPLDSPTRRHSSKSKQSRRHHSSGGSVGSPSRDPLESSSKPRRHKNSGDLDSPTRDSPGRTRRIQNSILGSESPSQGHQPRIPKQSRQKKTKGSTGGGSSTPSRSKGLDHLDQNLPYSDPGPGPG